MQLERLLRHLVNFPACSETTCEDAAGEEEEEEEEAVVLVGVVPTPSPSPFAEDEEEDKDKEGIKTGTKSPPSLPLPSMGEEDNGI